MGSHAQYSATNHTFLHCAGKTSYVHFALEYVLIIKHLKSTDMSEISFKHVPGPQLKWQNLINLVE